MTVAPRFLLSRHAIFRLISQTRIHYAESLLSEGEAGEVEGGDRLPWVPAAGTDNFASLRSLDWQVHVYGDVDDAFAAACRELALAVHTFPWSDAARAAGLKQDAAYLVRPDGYIALAAAEQDVAKLKNFVDRLSLRFPARMPAG